MIRYMLLSLVVTEAAELFTAFFLKIRKVYDLRLVFLVNLMTNPLMSFFYMTAKIYWGREVIWITAAAELAVWLFEAAIYKKCLEKKCSCLFLSAAANTMSIAAGYFTGRFLLL